MVGDRGYNRRERTEEEIFGQVMAPGSKFIKSRSAHTIISCRAWLRDRPWCIQSLNSGGGPSEFEISYCDQKEDCRHEQMLSRVEYFPKSLYNTKVAPSETKSHASSEIFFLA